MAFYTLFRFRICIHRRGRERSGPYYYRILARKVMRSACSCSAALRLAICLFSLLCVWEPVWVVFLRSQSLFSLSLFFFLLRPSLFFFPIDPLHCTQYILRFGDRA